MKIEVTIGGISKREIEAVPYSADRWYVRVNGAPLRARAGSKGERVRTFASEAAALRAGRNA